MKLPFFTIGHSNRSLEDFVELLSRARIELVADIRTIPRSRTNPQFNEDTLWKGKPHDYVRAGAGGQLAEIRRLVFEGKAGEAGKLSVPTVDHYVPMLYSLGLASALLLHYVFLGMGAQRGQFRRVAGNCFGGSEQRREFAP